MTTETLSNHGYNPTTTTTTTTTTTILPAGLDARRCYTAAGQSGSPIYDLADYRVMGVLSGGPVTWEFASDLSFWTPIDAFHFASLVRQLGAVLLDVLGLLFCVARCYGMLRVDGTV